MGVRQIAIDTTRMSFGKILQGVSAKLDNVLVAGKKTEGETTEWDSLFAFRTRRDGQQTFGADWMQNVKDIYWPKK